MISEISQKKGYLKDCKAGCPPAPTSHILKSGVVGRSLRLMGLTPHCVTYCYIASHMLIRVRMWSDWLFLYIKGIVKHCSVETFSSALACPCTYSLSSHLDFYLWFTKIMVVWVRVNQSFWNMFAL